MGYLPSVKLFPLLITKGKNRIFKWRNVADITLTKWLKLPPPIMNGQVRSDVLDISIEKITMLLA